MPSRVIVISFAEDTIDRGPGGGAGHPHRDHRLAASYRSPESVLQFGTHLHRQPGVGHPGARRPAGARPASRCGRGRSTRVKGWRRMAYDKASAGHHQPAGRLPRPGPRALLPPESRPGRAGAASVGHGAAVATVAARRRSRSRATGRGGRSPARACRGRPSRRTPTARAGSSRSAAPPTTGRTGRRRGCPARPGAARSCCSSTFAGSSRPAATSRAIACAASAISARPP